MISRISVAGHMDEVNTKGFSNFWNDKAFKSNRKLMRNIMRKVIGNKALSGVWIRFQEKRYTGTHH